MVRAARVKSEISIGFTLQQNKTLNQYLLTSSRVAELKRLPSGCSGVHVKSNCCSFMSLK